MGVRFLPGLALCGFVLLPTWWGFPEPGVSVHAAAADVTPQQADVFDAKVGQIKQGATPQGRRTAISEGELNSWFAYRAGALLPSGVTAPTLTILGDGRVSGHVTVDLDAMARPRANGGMLDPWSYLSGKVPVGVSGLLKTANGVGRFEMDSADVSGVPVPKTLVQELISRYSRSATRPEGIRLDEQFELPANIKQIEVGVGRAVVVQ